jgi:hypothetical protein
MRCETGAYDECLWAGGRGEEEGCECFCCFAMLNISNYVVG